MNKAVLDNFRNKKQPEYELKIIKTKWQTRNFFNMKLFYQLK